MQNDSTFTSSHDQLAQSASESQRASGSEVPPINLDLLLKRCLGDLEFMDTLLCELESTGESRVAEIAKHVEETDCHQTAEAAHALKGTAAVLGAESVHRLAANIEDLCRTGKLEGVSEMLVSLQDEMVRCLRFIPAHAHGLR